jgi:hypothetical protein
MKLFLFDEIFRILNCAFGFIAVINRDQSNFIALMSALGVKFSKPGFRPESHAFSERSGRTRKCSGLSNSNFVSICTNWQKSRDRHQKIKVWLKIQKLPRQHKNSVVGITSKSNVFLKNN